jgi:hypothetical protein
MNVLNYSANNFEVRIPVILRNGFISLFISIFFFRKQFRFVNIYVIDSTCSLSHYYCYYYYYCF